ncbi:energy-coupling factor ABC transporter permease [Gynuella sp.]|uniref:energy-coupling factor ABC transporter permease n=1 Tax=Gynuella sp. TaxID=2969146 RepID=UPI003D0D3C44
MHIEPGVVSGAKIFLSYGTALGAAGYMIKHISDTIKQSGTAAFALRSLLATILVFCFFEVLPHFPVGVSEVHLILGTTLLLILGTGPAAVGLMGGLLVQGLFFAPFDLPQYGMNVTTLLVPLFATAVLARRIIPNNTAYVDISYGQALKLSFAYQGGIVSWVAFWAFYGHGFSTDNLASVFSFGVSYMSVIIAEPLIDLGVLAIAKRIHGLRNSRWVEQRLY